MMIGFLASLVKIQHKLGKTKTNDTSDLSLNGQNHVWLVLWNFFLSDFFHNTMQKYSYNKNKKHIKMQHNISVYLSSL